jgi:hypothetical protein
VGTNDPQDRTNLTAGTYTVTVTDANGCKTTLSITISQPTKVNATSTQVNTTCGLCNGSIDVSVSGGTSPYTYDWTDLVGTNDPQDRSSLCSGTYTVYVTDAQGCKDTLTVTIASSSKPELTSTQVNTTCGLCNGSIDVSVSGGTSPYTYDWTDLVGTNDPQDRSSLCSGTYTVYVTDAQGCKDTLTVTISDIGGPSVTETHTNVTCFSGNDGSIDISVSGGTSPYTYDWTDLVGTNDPQDRTNLTAGTYTVTVTDANGCKTTLSITISQPTKVNATSTQVNTTCGLCNGSIDVSVSGGTSPYTYDWTDLVGTNDPQDRSSLCSGTYTVYVTDAQGCKDTLTVMIASSSKPELTSTQVNTTCGLCNGSIDVSVSGGTSPYTYDWTDLVGTNDPQDRSSLCSGTYTVYVTDAQGCKDTLTVTIASSSKPELTSTQVNTTCGLCNGSIDVSVSGGTSPYTYDWTDLVGTNDPQDRTSLCSGTYTVYVTDAQGCKDTLTVTIAASSKPELTSTQVNTTCGLCNGSIDVSVSGGTSPYTYDWTDLVGTNDPQDRSSLCSGTYTVYVTDAQGCKDTLTVTIAASSKPELTSTQVNTTCGLCNGSIDVSVSGGTSPYTYDWTDLVGTNDPQDRSSLCSGTYTVYVTDAQGCKDTLTVTIATSSKPELTSTQVNTTCGLCNGSIDVSVSGGTSPYTYDWTDLVGTNDPQDRSSLCSGTYTVYVTDAQGCKDTLTVTIVDIGSGIDIIVKEVHPSLCSFDDGYIIINVIGGKKPYTITWNTTPVQYGYTAINLAPGNYTVTVVDSLGCIESLDVFVPEVFNPLPSDTIVVLDKCLDSIEYCIPIPFSQLQKLKLFIDDNPYLQFEEGCNIDTIYSYDLSLGFIGSAPLNCNKFKLIKWVVNGSNVFSSQFIFNSIPELVDSMNAHEPISTTWSYNPVEHQILNTITNNPGIYGVLEIKSFCGNLPIYEFNLNTLKEPKGTNINITTDGCKWIVVETEDGSCKDSMYVCFVKPNPPTILSEVEVNTYCNDSTGYVLVNMQGNNSNYTYSWSPAIGNINSIGNGMYNLPAGIYIVTITDKITYCSIMDTLIVDNTNSPADTVSTIITGETCDAKNGSIVLNPTNYTYEWMDGFIGSTRNNLESGNYVIKVISDVDTLCERIITILIPQIEGNILVNYTIDTLPNCNESNGQVTLNISGGTSPYTILWNDGSTALVRSDLSAGTYFVEVTDANGCKEIKAIVIENITNGDAEININGIINNNCASDMEGEILYDITIIGNVYAPLTVSITDANNLNVINGTLKEGLYTISVRDSLGCLLDVESFEITTPELLELIVDRYSDTCNLAKGSLDITILGGTAPYTVLWNDGSTSIDRFNLSEGSYTVTVTDANGCTVSATEEIVSYNENCTPCITPEIYSSVELNARCGENNGSVAVNMVGNNSDYTYIWTPQTGTLNSVGNEMTNLGEGVYYVLITDKVTGCIVRDTLIVTNVDGPIVSSISTSSATCDAANGSATLLPNSYVYTWQDGYVGNSRNDLIAQEYIVNVLDPISGCESNIRVVIPRIETPLTVSYTITDEPTCNTSDGDVTVDVSGGSSPYTVTWLIDGVISSTRTDLSAGVYSISVSDVNGCTKDTFVVIPRNEGSTGDITITSVINNVCFGNTSGTINYTVIPTSATVTIYDMLGNVVTNGSLGAGKYSVEATDALGCVLDVEMVEILEPKRIDVIINRYPDTCGKSKGSVTLSTVGGTPSYVYDWSDIPGTNNPRDRSGLSAGTYSVTVTDANGCNVDKTFILENVDLGCDTPCITPEIYSSVELNARCGENNGSVAVNMVGNNSDYTYIWTPQTGTLNSVGNEMTNLGEGVYYVLITDKVTGCIVRDTLIVTNVDGPIVSSISTSSATCDAANGSATLLPNSYVYTWQDGYVGNSRNDLIAQEYIVNVLDPISGCESNIRVVIPRIETPLTVSYTITDEPTCNTSDGDVTVDVSGGSSPYTVTWLIDGVISSTRTDLSAGVYSISVSDVNGCTKDTFVVIPRNEGSTGDITITSVINNVCFGNTSGTINYTVIPTSATVTIYDMLGNVVTNGSLGAGKYSVEATDALGCVLDVEMVEILEPKRIDVIINRYPDTCGKSKGSVTLSTVGGTPSYVYDWSDIPGTNNPRDRSGLSAGTYSVTVTDANGCNVDKTFILENVDLGCIYKPDTLFDTIPVNDSTPPLCATADDILNTSGTTYTFCDNMPYNGGYLTTDPVTGCPVYHSGPTSGNAVDTICVVATDSLGNTDTTVWIISITPKPDTLFDTIPVNDSTPPLCATADDILNTSGTTYTFCDNMPYNGGYLTTDPVTGCPVYHSGPTSGNAVDTICVVATDSLGNTDTTVWIISITPKPDTLFDTIPVNDSTPPLCATADDILNTSGTTYTFCDNMPYNGGYLTTDPVTGCPVYHSGPTSGNAVDTICVVATDSLGNTDTTVWIISITPKPDTLFDTIPVNDSTPPLCATADDILNTSGTTYTFCDNMPYNGGYLTTDPVTGCPVYHSGPTSGNAVDTICVVATDSLGNTDTTVWIISVTPHPDTLFDTIPVNDSTPPLCATADDILNTSGTTYTFCDNMPYNGGYLTTDPVTGCPVYHSGPTSGNAVDTICVVATDSLGNTDTTVWIISITPKSRYLIRYDTSKR